MSGVTPVTVQSVSTIIVLVAGDGAEGVTQLGANARLAIQTKQKSCGACAPSLCEDNHVQGALTDVQMRFILMLISADPPGVERVRTLYICWSLDPPLTPPGGRPR